MSVTPADRPNGQASGDARERGLLDGATYRRGSQRLRTARRIMNPTRPELYDTAGQTWIQRKNINTAITPVDDEIDQQRGLNRRHV